MLKINIDFFKERVDNVLKNQDKERMAFNKTIETLETYINKKYRIGFTFGFLMGISFSLIMGGLYVWVR